MASTIRKIASVLAFGLCAPGSAQAAQPIRYNTLGVYTAPIGGSKMSHAGFFGTSGAAVSKPESDALMLAGLGLMGAIVRRRKAK